MDPNFSRSPTSNSKNERPFDRDKGLPHYTKIVPSIKYSIEFQLLFLRVMPLHQHNQNNQVHSINFHENNWDAICKTS